MNSFETAIIAAVKTSINDVIEKYVEEFAESVVTLVSEKKNASREEIIDVWNKIALEFTIKEKHKSKHKSKKKTKKGEVKVDESGDEVVEQQTCMYEMKKGRNAGNVCGKNVSDKSETGNYCSKHLKEEQNDKVDESGDEVVEQQTCMYKRKKGPKAGNVCGKNVSDKSSTGNYCSKHLKEEHIEKRELSESELKGKRWDYFLNLNLDFDDNDDSDYEYEELEDIEDDSAYERNEDSDILESEVEEYHDDDNGNYEL